RRMSEVRRARGRRVLALALGGALFGHAVALVAQDAVHEPERLLVLAIAAPVPGEDAPDADGTIDLAQAPEPVAATVVALDARDLAALQLIAVPGPGDDAAWGASPMPSASADLPGLHAADRGGGDDGGAATWTGRRDPDQTALRAQLWD